MDAIQKCNKSVSDNLEPGFQKKKGTGSGMPQVLLCLEKTELVTDTKIIEDRLQKLAEKYYPTVEEVEKEMMVLQEVVSSYCNQN